MKHLLHLNKLWIICHFMSIQTIDVACIWRCLMWFLIWLCCLYGCHCGLFFLLFAFLHIVIHHPTICVIFVSLPYITMCFHWYCLFGTVWYWKCIPCSAIVMLSHNIAASLCCCSVDHFISIITIMRYDCKPILNTIVRKLSWLVLVNHELVFESTHSKPPPF
jgi:hypothetical protein